MQTRFTSIFAKAAFALLLVILAPPTEAWADALYEIGSYAQLKDFANIVNSGNTGVSAVLTANIVCKNTIDDEGYATDWTPIGNNTHRYTGVFDGAGYTITGLSTPTDNTSNNVGLFGIVGSEGVVKNVGLKDVTLTGDGGVGGFVGENSGTVQNCCLIGVRNITATSSNVGGIVGYNSNSGTIQNCYVAISGSITTTGPLVGGIVGFNGGTVSCCYYAGTGEIGGSDNVGAIIGMNLATAECCYYNVNNTTVIRAIGNADNTENVKGLTAAQFQDLNNFSGFSSDVWLQGVVAPLLKGMPYTISFNANGGTGSMASQTVTSEDDDVLSANTFTRSGYHFIEWNTKVDGLGVAVATDVEARQVGPETLYAQWCANTNLTAHAAIEATCTTAGNTAYWSCSVCGKYFSDAAGTTEISANSWVIPATGHTLIKHEEDPATCTTAGSSAFWECENCHKYFSDAQGTNEIAENSWVIPATGHYFGDWVVSTPAKCLEIGSKYRECTVCHTHEYDDIPALGHDFVDHAALAATCTTVGHTAYQGCSRCDYKNGYTEIPALTHNIENGECTLCHRVTTAYVDADGTGKSELAMPLNNTMTTLEAGWYVVNGNIEFNSGITLNGDVNLILADGYQMNIGTSEARISDTGIDGLNGSTTYDLEIFGQSNGTGAISVYTSGSYNHGIRANVLTINGGHITANTAGYASALIARGTTALTINGGTVSATTDGDYYALASNGDFNYNGGNVITSAPNGKAIFASRKYTFSWRSATDRITIGSTGLYTGLNASSKTATFTRLFTDADGNYYGGTMTGEDALATLAGKTLSGTTELVLANDADNSARIAAANGVSGLDVKLDSRTLQANIWNTLCVPFNLDGTQIESIFGAGTLVKTLSSYDNDGTTVTITFATANTIEAGKPYIILLPEGASNMVNPVFSNVVIDETMNDVTAGDATFKGTYSPTPLTANDKKMLFLANNKLWYPTADVTVRACRAYFELTTAVPELSNSAPNIVIDFGEETTSLSEELRVKSEEFATAAWYTLDGRKLSGKPTTKGIYINGGHKVVVK